MRCQMGRERDFTRAHVSKMTEAASALDYKWFQSEASFCERCTQDTVPEATTEGLMIDSSV